jgi:DNA-binding response OmpR family regulator
VNHAGDVLVVEDHHDIAEMVCDHLESRGYSVDYAGDGPAGLRLGRDHVYDAVVLDLMLPGMDGLEVCRALRAAHVDVPLLMLTARDTLGDKLAGFDCGADDYLVKPFDLEELEVRLRALIRRRRGAAGEVLRVGDLTLDLGSLKVARAERELTVTPIGLKILTLLMQQSPRVVDRQALERAVWGDLPPDSDALRSHLYVLRKTVDRPFARALIHTVPGAGVRIADED